MTIHSVRAIKHSTEMNDTVRPMNWFMRHQKGSDAPAIIRSFYFGASMFTRISENHPIRESQTTADVLMIRPANFLGNTQTFASNRFQRADLHYADSRQAARIEFDGFTAALKDAGVRVHIFEDSLERHTPDAVFPNNWVSFHADGTVVLYPMMAANRRLERRPELISQLAANRVIGKYKLIDLSPFEEEGIYLEGTGSLVLDRSQRIAYACRSPRTHEAAVREFARQLNYETVIFDAADQSGAPIYHTNVLMSIGTRFAVLNPAAIHANDCDRVLAALRATRHHVIEISNEQMHAFAGNMLELSTAEGQVIIALSRRAAESLSADQLHHLQELGGPLVASPLTIVENLGGGSARCMLAEIHSASAATAP